MKILYSLSRIYADDMDRALSFYENLADEKCSLRFKYAEIHLELARVGPFLIIAGSEKHLKPFRETGATLIVDSVSEFKEYVLTHGGGIIRDITKVPTGYNVSLRNPDGSVFEYVQFENNSSERADEN